MWVCENRTSTPYFAAGGCRHWREMWLPGSLLPVSAGNATAYTYTISQDEEWMVTQDAYLVSRVLMREHAMTSPRDLFVKENRLYLADTGASRVLIYQLDTGDCPGNRGRDAVFPGRPFRGSEQRALCGR